MSTPIVTQFPVSDHDDAASAAFQQFADGLANLSIEIHYLEAQRQRISTLLRVRRLARTHLTRQYRAAQDPNPIPVPRKD